MHFASMSMKITVMQDNKCANEAECTMILKPCKPAAITPNGHEQQTLLLSSLLTFTTTLITHRLHIRRLMFIFYDIPPQISTLRLSTRANCSQPYCVSKYVHHSIFLFFYNFVTQ